MDGNDIALTILYSLVQINKQGMKKRERGGASEEERGEKKGRKNAEYNGKQVSN